ncbi:AbfB domain-containing protein [Streptomyces avermitilis]|uniref:AbfB domain-containing protein n=1 Tax=Streptomyces avermitilis TaxID=33903 RepID=UPI00380401BD
MTVEDRGIPSDPPVPSRRGILRALLALPATALVWGGVPGPAGWAAAAAPSKGYATRYTIVPFLNSNDGVVNVYQSDDATDFRLLNYPTRYWQEQSSLLNLPVVSSAGSSAEKAASAFTVVAGLADAGGFSFRDAAGNHLRHYDYRARFDAHDGTSTFAKDATYIARTGTAAGSVRFESYNYPGYYLRHYHYQLRVDPTDGTDQLRQDSSFTPVTAWA